MPMSLHVELSLPRLSFLHLPWTISAAHQDSANCSGDSLLGNLPGSLPLTPSEQGPLHGHHFPSAHNPLLVQLFTCPCPLLVCKVPEDGDPVLFAFISLRLSTWRALLTVIIFNAIKNHYSKHSFHATLP